MAIYANVLYRNHLGRKKTIDKITSRFYRPYLQTAIKKIIREWEVCQKPDFAPQKDEEDEPETTKMLKGKKDKPAKKNKKKISTSESSSSQSEVEWDESDEETIAEIKQKLKRKN
ncbi:unnamed protein product [Brachionus calyciflorus]|uniref:Integrase zinc-binding domain-containing protein n=1 Tax=Brachionus calyciflorus TaxID=104777 RepID=A0A814M8W7_9BILA|nr:unnamed protein product [Brachionus calyciflorus]